MDTNGDGTLDAAEVRSVMHSMGKKFTDAEFEEAMAEMDKDGCQPPNPQRTRERIPTIQRRALPQQRPRSWKLLLARSRAPRAPLC